MYKNAMCKLCNCCEKWSPYFLSLLRVVIALLLLQHGGQKVFGYPESRLATPPLFSWPLGIAGILELVGGLLLLLGLFTRPAAFILSGQMAVAYFMVHFPEAWWPIHNRGELAVIYCFVFLYLVAAGPGPLSLDRFLKCCGTPPGEKTCCAAPPDEGKKNDE
jgi:putative oxidoreductase